LRSNAYCHFTSPIRRYPDLVCHRALLTTLGEGERGPKAHELAELGVWASEREREAMAIEREADDVARSFALERELFDECSDRVFGGEVVGLIPAGAFVAFGYSDGEESGGDRPPARPRYEGMLPFRTLTAPSGEQEWWELGEEQTIARGQRTGAALRLADQVQVRVVRVDARRGRVDLARAVEEPAARGARKRPAR
jgi:ribonuclease R